MNRRIGYRVYGAQHGAQSQEGTRCVLFRAIVVSCRRKRESETGGDCCIVARDRREAGIFLKRAGVIGRAVMHSGIIHTACTDLAESPLESIKH